jgi:hypothetical protein
MAIRCYGMFTDSGNRRVGTIVKRSLAKRWTWSETYRALAALAESNEDKFGEVLDTDVREQVYSAIGAEKRNESFWVY